MLTNGGVWVSECPLGTGVTQMQFPRRNRILAGMVDALIVVESAAKGGALITAKLANDYDREVMALPGPYHSPYSRGCNGLIKQHRAHLLEAAEDLVRLMNWDVNQRKTPIPELDENERLVLDRLKQEGILHFDQLLHRLQLSNSKLASSLLTLEMKNCISSLPGKRYQGHGH
jgi:DNA processing protein